jgi:hypothetical protein
VNREMEFTSTLIKFNRTFYALFHEMGSNSGNASIQGALENGERYWVELQDILRSAECIRSEESWFIGLIGSLSGNEVHRENIEKVTLRRLGIGILVSRKWEKTSSLLSGMIAWYKESNRILNP